MGRATEEAAELREDAELRAFRDNRDRRAQRLADEHWIADVAVTAILKFVFVVACFPGLLIVTDRWGLLGFVGFFVALGVWLQIWEFLEKGGSRYGRDVLDEQAEEVVRFERIVALDVEDKDWTVVEVLEGPPYWELVNKKVRRFVQLTYRQRQADLKNARKASIAARLRMEAKFAAAGRPGKKLPEYAQLTDQDRRRSNVR